MGDDEDGILEEIMNGHFIQRTEKPISWGNKDLSPQEKDEKVQMLEERIP